MHQKCALCSFKVWSHDEYKRIWLVEGHVICTKYGLGTRYCLVRIGACTVHLHSSTCPMPLQQQSSSRFPFLSLWVTMSQEGLPLVSDPPLCPEVFLLLSWRHCWRTPLSRPILLCGSQSMVLFLLSTWMSWSLTLSAYQGCGYL